MRKKKRLQIVLSPHFDPEANLNPSQITNLTSAVTLRNRIIEEGAIHSNQHTISFFSDGMGEEEAIDFNSKVRKLTDDLSGSLDRRIGIQGMTRALPYAGEFEQGNRFGEMTGTFYTAVKVGLQGKKPEFKETESPNYKNRPIYQRDNDMMRNVSEQSGRHNILYAGSNHTSLVSTKRTLNLIDEYDVETIIVKPIGKEILVGGLMPNNRKVWLEETIAKYEADGQKKGLLPVISKILPY